MNIKKLFTRIRSVTLAVACLPVVSAAASFPPARGDEVTLSLGQYKIVINPVFQPLFVGPPDYPGYDGAGRLLSPVLNDSATVIGRSAPHTQGSAADLGGTLVGTGAGTPAILDASFSIIPPGFNAGPATRREVHTRIKNLNMTSGGSAVRAGANAPGRPISPGEVESYDATGTPALDFPAQSFFDIFVEVDMPSGLPDSPFLGATVINTTALVVQNTNLTHFPPDVIYDHLSSSAVPIYFTTDTAQWDPGDELGILVLAGHGVYSPPNTNPSPAQVAQFVNAIQQMEESPVLPKYQTWAPLLKVVPVITNIVVSPGLVQVQCQGKIGGQYLLVGTPSLSPATWSPVGNGVAGNDPLGSFIINVSTTAPQGFFRLVSSP